MSARTNKAKRKKNALKALLSSPPKPQDASQQAIDSPATPTTPTEVLAQEKIEGYSHTKERRRKGEEGEEDEGACAVTFDYRLLNISSNLPVGSLLKQPVMGKLKEYDHFTKGLTFCVRVCGVEVQLECAHVEKKEGSLIGRIQGMGLEDRVVDKREYGRLKFHFRKVDDVNTDTDTSTTSTTTASTASTKDDTGISVESNFYGYLEFRSKLSKILETEPDGILLSGPSGSGKTSLVKSLLKTVKHVYVDCTTLIHSVQGYGERLLADILTADATKRIVVLDNVDCVGRDRSKGGGNRNLTNTLLALLDSFRDSDTTNGNDGKNNTNSTRVYSRPVVVGICKTLTDMDVAFRRPGRFSYEYILPSPDDDDRKLIVQGCLNDYSDVIYTGNVHVQSVVDDTRGYVSSDILHLIKTTISTLLLANTNVLTTEDILKTISLTPPTSLKDLAVTIPSLPWSSIGGMLSTKKSLQETISHTLTYPEVYKKYNVVPPNGILLYGPPGCSKTLMAKALCSSTSMNFIAIKGPELLSKYLGQSETKLQQIFVKAREASPCVVFFDEIDSIASARGSSGGASDRLLAQLLTELDGVRGRDPMKRVVVVGATNRPDLIDPALVRPGRIDRMVYVGPPDDESRVQIWQIGMKGKAISDDIDYDKLGELSEGMSGAEIVGCCRDAAIRAIVSSSSVICMEHCVAAATDVQRMITSDMIGFYENFRDGLEDK